MLSQSLLRTEISPDLQIIPVKSKLNNLCVKFHDSKFNKNVVFIMLLFKNNIT